MTEALLFVTGALMVLCVGAFLAVIRQAIRATWRR